MQYFDGSPTQERRNTTLALHTSTILYVLLQDGNVPTCRSTYSILTNLHDSSHLHNIQEIETLQSHVSLQQCSPLLAAYPKNVFAFIQSIKFTAVLHKCVYLRHFSVVRSDCCSLSSVSRAGACNSTEPDRLWLCAKVNSSLFRGEGDMPAYILSHGYQGFHWCVCSDDIQQLVG